MKINGACHCGQITYEAEIDPEKGLLRKSILPFKGNKIDDGMTFALQPIVSPNGRWLAIATAAFEKDSKGRLLLVDLQSESLEVKTVDPPEPANN